MKDKELLSLPLFMGMSSSELSALLEEGRISSCAAPKGAVLAKEDAPCQNIIVLASGTLKVVTNADDNSYQMEEILHAPMVVQPERLFGLTQRYTATVTTTTVCHYVSMTKSNLIAAMQSSMSFRINVLNLLSTQAQRSNRQVWHQQNDNIAKRIIRFIKDRSSYPTGTKVLRIKMMTLARELGCSRLEISEALHELEDREWILMRRGAIEVPMLQLLRD